MDVLDDRGFQKEVDTVRALHQTVVSLRAALERSRIEIEQLKERVWSSDSCELALQTLSVENHILRQKIINVDVSNEFKENTTQTSLPYITVESPEINNSNAKNTKFEDNNSESLDKTSCDEINSLSTEIYNSPRKSNISTNPSPRHKETPRETPSFKSARSPDSIKENNKISPKKIKIKSETSPRDTHVLKEKTKSPRNISKESESKSNSDKLKTNKHQQHSPRQTVVTVNVTLKSPKLNKNKSKTTENITFDAPQILIKNETSESDKIKQVNLNNLNKKMEEQTNKVVEQEEAETVPDKEDDKTVNNDSEQRNRITEQKGSDTEGEEVDDIELIFTTDETTTVIKEELVSIADGNEDDENCDTPVLLNYRTVDFDTSDLQLSCENLDKDIDDDVFHENETTDNFENENTENLNFQNCSFQVPNSKSDNSLNKDSVNNLNESQRDKSLKSCYSYQDSSFESRSLDKDESFDKFDDKEKYLHKMWSNNSVLVETDISKCGIVDPELPISTSRRNTCPNPAPYRPIMHREALAKRSLGVKFNSRYDSNLRPILNENQSPKTESEAQTDISALPSLWKSESYLAHKVSHQFTTLPSKFPMPISQKSLRLHEKTKEARRILLSDINFTSMVPELSRSADHLYQEGLEVMQTCGYGQYLNPPGPQLRRYNTGDSLTSPNFIHSQKFTWSPSDYSNFSSTKFDNSNMYLNRYRGSLSSINNQNSFEVPDNVKRRSYSTSHWRQNTPASFDNNRYLQSGQGPYRSVPNSPTRSRSVPFMSNIQSHSQPYSSGFKHSYSRIGRTGYGGFRYINGSLPELHGDHDSGDSTDSLVEEAEQYLRSSIDCIVSGRDLSHASHSTKRRSSAPCAGRDSSPPRNWKPFLPHGIKDLRSDNWVKVIGPEGKIRGGRVRYVGYVLGQQDPFVGIELSTNIGNSDGSFNNRRYFESSPNHALFLPFKKVIMGWRN